MPKGPGGDRSRNKNLIYSASLTLKCKPEQRERIMRLVKESGLPRQEWLIQPVAEFLHHDDAELISRTKNGAKLRRAEWLEHIKGADRVKKENGGFTRVSPAVQVLIDEAKSIHLKETGFSLSLSEKRPREGQLSLGDRHGN